MKAPKFKVRASAIGKIMTNPSTKKDQEAGLLSKTCQTYIQEFAIEQKYGRRLDFTSKYTEKGKRQEQQGITLLSKVLLPGIMVRSNTERFENEWISGEPDVIIRNWNKGEGLIIDNKCPWSLKSHPLFTDADKNYIWQGFGYMDLLEIDNFWLVYCLVDTPIDMVLKEMQKYAWEHEKMDLSDQESFEVAKNHIFTMEGIEEMRVHFPTADVSSFIPIPDEKRVRRFEYKYSEEMKKQFVLRCEQCQEYLDSIWNLI